MARKKAETTADEVDVSGNNLTIDTSAQPNGAAVPADAIPLTFEPIQINNYNLTDLKNTLDDALKRCLARPDCYSQIHMHTDVRLALGWVAVLVAAATGLYSWKISFQESRLGVFIGVTLYALLSAVQMGYIYFIEGDTVFVGKRKTLDKRIQTERLTASSKTTRPKPQSPAPATAPTLPLSTFYPRATSTYLPPHYHLTVNYALTVSGGKALIRANKVEDERCYADFFDSKGNLDEARFVAWVSAMLEKAEDEGKSQ
ncbi:hypothetical protein FS837_006504 [Tulasnella sp. UAMH 9824]|nr:hypothetical protein FS837_006504 [Tulasnella sp. UAMH 9824]